MATGPTRSSGRAPRIGPGPRDSSCPTSGESEFSLFIKFVDVYFFNKKKYMPLVKELKIPLDVDKRLVSDIDKLL